MFIQALLKNLHKQLAKNRYTCSSDFPFNAHAVYKLAVVSECTGRVSTPTRNLVKNARMTMTHDASCGTFRPLSKRQKSVGYDA